MELTRPSSTATQIEARLERIPLLRWHWGMLGVVGIAQAVEIVDSLAASFALPVLISLWSLTATEAGILVSSMYAGQMIGSASFGWLSDKLGRLSLLKWATAALVGLGLIAACATSYSWFLFFRFLQGIAFGAELVLASTYIAELSSSSFRGRLMFGLNIIFSAAGILAAVIATFVVPAFGWRWIFVIAALGSLPFFLLASRLPESPRWLASRGRIDAANAIVEAIEKRAIMSGAPLSAPLVSANISETEPPKRWRDLLAADFRAQTALLWIMALTIGTVGISMISWLPRFFQLAYNTPLQSTLAMSAASFTAPLFGSIFGALFVDRLRRETALLLGYLGLSIMLFAMWQLMGKAPIPVAVALGFGVILFQSFLMFMLYLIAVEYYPTQLRGAGSGAARFWLSISAITGPIGAGYVTGRWGVSGTLGTLLVAALIGLATVLLLRRSPPSQTLLPPG